MALIGDVGADRHTHVVTLMNNSDTHGNDLHDGQQQKRKHNCVIKNRQ